jgi:hypothetical protein
VLRGVQWLNVDEEAGGRLTNWSSRPLLSDAGWSSKRGVPLEVVLQICNAVSADCWLNVPHQASDDYITLKRSTSSSATRYGIRTTSSTGTLFSKVERPGPLPVQVPMNITAAGTACAPRRCVISGRQCGAATERASSASSPLNLGICRRPYNR